MAAIWYEVDSDSMGNNQVRILQAKEGEDPVDLYRGTRKERNLRTDIPIGASLAAITEKIGELNGLTKLPRGVELDTDAEIQEMVRQLTEADHFMLSSLIVIALPSFYDAVQDLKGTQDEQLMLEEAEGTTVGKRYKKEFEAGPREVEIERGRIIGYKTDTAALLRAYRVYGLLREDNVAEEGVTEEDLLDILGFDVEPAEAKEVGEPRRVATLPYAEFPVGELENCLVAGLVKKYAQLPASRRIAQSSIESWFGEENGGPSLWRLKEFCDRYKVPLRVFDVLGAEIYALHHENPGKAGGRPGIVMVAYNNHAYFSTAALNKARDFTAKVATDIEGLYESRPGLTDKDGNPLGDQEEAVLESAMGVGRPNFSYAAERDIIVKCLNWSSAGQHCCGEKGDDPVVVAAAREKCGCKRECWDMRKAFYTALTLTKEQCPKLANYMAAKIPVFSAMDDYRLAGEAPIPPRSYWPVTYFFLKDESLRRLRSLGGHCAGRAASILTGPELAYLIDTGRLTEDDLQGWKQATYAVEESKFRTWLDGLDPVPAEPAQEPALAQAPQPRNPPGYTVKKMFALINGLLGRVETAQHRVSLVVDSEDDLALLGVSHTRVSGEMLPDGRQNVTVILGERRYRHLNARNFYHHVISRTNLMMMQLVDDIAAANPEAKLQKIATDAVLHDRPVELPEWARPFWKQEVPRVYGHRSEARFTDLTVVRSASAVEIEEVCKKCNVLVGAPGTGKTYTVHNEYEYDISMAFSNLCARNLDVTKGGQLKTGQTLHQGLGLYSPRLRQKALDHLRGKTLWIDEFSTIQSWVWSVIFDIMGRGGKVLILTGDPNQSAPVMESFRRSSQFMQRLLGGATVLTTDHRNDEKLIELRNFINETTESHKARIIDHVKDIIEKRPKAGVDSCDDLAAVDVHLVVTNRLRVAINHYIVAQRGLKYQVVGTSPARKSHIWEASKGLRLRALVTRKAAGIYKGGVYELMKLVFKPSSDFQVRRIHLDGRPPEAVVKMPIKDFVMFELGYALTVASSIGVTIKQRVAIHQCRMMIDIDKNNFYTAITRACRLEDIIFGLETPKVLTEEMHRVAEAAEVELPAPPSPEDDDPFDADNAEYVAEA